MRYSWTPELLGTIGPLVWNFDSTKLCRINSKSPFLFKGPIVPSSSGVQVCQGSNCASFKLLIQLWRAVAAESLFQIVTAKKDHICTVDDLSGSASKKSYYTLHYTLWTVNDVPENDPLGFLQLLRGLFHLKAVKTKRGYFPVTSLTVHSVHLFGRNPSSIYS